MNFQALTGSPSLAEGVRLNVMATPQVPGESAAQLALGDLVVVRCGNCCPDVSEGTIASSSADRERAVLRLGTSDWAIERDRNGAGVEIPGILSEDWYVRGPASSCA